MISHDIKSECMDARLYYHDFLSDQTKGNIPENALGHIICCRHCQEEISRLESILSQANGKEEQNWQNSAVTAILKLHFAYINKSVSCSAAKPFLSSLIMPELKISIPTPITVHIDNCPACSNDLSALRDFGLNQGQLFRLGRFLAEKSVDDKIECSNAQLAMQPTVLMEFRKTNAEILRHFCICPDCRKSLYENREVLREELLNNRISQDKFPCREVSTTDMFSYCIPYGIDPANDEYEEFRESLTSHLSGCPTCLGKIQQLHTDIYNITERKDSGIITCFTLQEQNDQAVENESLEKCADWPINVQVINQKELTETVYSEELNSSSIKHKQRTGTLKLKRFIKPALAAAAMILIACTLFFSTPSAKAVTLAQIYQALEKVKNIHISRYAPNKAEPIQEEWISQTLNIKFFKTGEELVLFDYNKSEKKTKFSDTSSTQVEHLPQNMITEGKESLKGSFGLLPFSDISTAKKEGQWNHVNDKIIMAIVPGTEVYDLTWTIKVDNFTTYYKLRFFVDTTTDLPRRIEGYQKKGNDSEYALQGIEIVAYPTVKETETIIIQSKLD